MHRVPLLPTIACSNLSKYTDPLKRQVLMPLRHALLKAIRTDMTAVCVAVCACSSRSKTEGHVQSHAKTKAGCQSKAKAQAKAMQN